MHLDVLDLRNFYYRRALGRVAQRMIRQQLLEFWPDAQAQTVAGFGFSLPVLRPYLDTARRVIALMPGQQGVMAWPQGQENVSVLCDETAWPLPTGFIDKLIVMHGLETSDYPTALLEEAHRVLGPGGRAVFVVPSRSGLWSRRDVTPFGYGKPYSVSQLETHLRRHDFTPERTASVLYVPPSEGRFWLRTADVWEKMGRNVPWLLGGVTLVEASKQVYAPTRGGLAAAVKKPLRVLGGVARPVPVPQSQPAPRGTGAQAGSRLLREGPGRGG